MARDVTTVKALSFIGDVNLEELAGLISIGNS